MADNFDVKQFLFENKLGAYSKLKNEGEAAYEYEKGKAAGEKEEEEKLKKEDLGQDRTDAEAEKMMDFLAEKDKTEEALSMDYIDRMEGLANVQDLAVLKTKLTLLTQEWITEGFEKEDVLEYIKHLLDIQFNEGKKEVEEALGGKNPEGDKLVLRFLQGISKKFDYPVSQAARFVKDTIKSLGY